MAQVIDLYNYFRNRKTTSNLSTRILNFKIKRLIFLNNDDYNITNFNYLLNTDNIMEKLNRMSNTSHRIHLTLILLILNFMVDDTDEEDEDKLFSINKTIFFYNHKYNRIKKLIKLFILLEIISDCLGFSTPYIRKIVFFVLSFVVSN